MSDEAEDTWDQWHQAQEGACPVLHYAPFDKWEHCKHCEHQDECGNAWHCDMCCNSCPNLDCDNNEHNPDRAAILELQGLPADWDNLCRDDDTEDL
jgi:hypothetical protein